MNKRQLLETISKVMNNAHNGRVSQKTLSYYRSMPEGDKVIAVVSKEAGVPVGVAAVRVNKGLADRAILVVNSENRRCTIAETLGKQLLDELKKQGLTLNCAIAGDNKPAMELSKKLGLHQVGSRYATRRSGSYTQIQLSNKPAPAEILGDTTDVFNFA